MDVELKFHLETYTEDLVRNGVPRQEALRQARLEFGGVELAKEECREARGVRLLETLAQDLRYGARMLRRKPTFTVVAILTLALGVGANTAIFSIVNAVLLRPLPYRDPGGLVRIYFNNPGIGMRDVASSVPELDDLRTRAGVFEDVTALGGGSVNLTGAKEPERLEFVVSYPNYFSMLGATPQIGRLFGPQDFALGFAPVAVISDGLWRRSYGADPSVLGRNVRLDNDLYTIIGVLPPGFRHPGPTLARDVEVWLSCGFSADPVPPPARATRFIPAAIGRLKPGVTLAQAQARLDVVAAELRREFANDYPPHAKWSIEIEPLQESLVGNVRPMLLVLLGAVILTVFIVSLNIGSLLLARATGRQQEMAVRSALGASRSRMVRQMLAESLLLSLVGGGAGVATAFATLGSILRFVPSNTPRLSEVSIDWVVLAFALLISLLTGLLFGLAPALHLTRTAVSSAIREGARGSGYSTRTGRMRDALIASEVALAVVLLVGAGLLLRTLRSLLTENPGFNPTQLVVADIWLPLPNDPKLDPYLSPANRIAFSRELLRRVSAIPGVELAGLTTTLPATARPVSISLTIEDRPSTSAQDLQAETIRVSPDYFRVMRAPLVRGRFFAESDEDGKEPVAMIDETTARRYWPDRDALGRRLLLGRDPTRLRSAQQWRTVVGIVQDIKSDGLDIDGVPHIYVPILQVPDRQLSVVLRTSLPASALEPQIRHEVQSIDPGLPVFSVTSMNEVLDASLAGRRFSADLVAGFAGMALLLASIGIYGLLAYMVGQESREIGLRMALGARPADVLKLVLRKGAILAGAGILAGVIFSAFAASLMASLLYGVRPHDPAVFLAAPLLLLLVALAASYIPARRATKVDPMRALREA
jgi:putative ABC transport system permease protein